jgi:8-oxo-dGTP pyrophosphatase MutT (NUDIX family)
MADSLYAQPSQPIEMKVFQGGGGLEGGGAGTSLLPTPATPIEMKVYQGGGERSGPDQEGGGPAERQKFEKGLVEYKNTKYFNRIQAAPRKPNSAIYFIDTEGRLAVCKRREPGDKAKDGKIMAAGGAVDPSDKQNFPVNPSILAALREGNEEIGINPFGIQDFTKLKHAERQALNLAVDEFIPLWNFGQVEAYIYLLKEDVPANGPDAIHKGELYTNYDFKEFGSNPALISKQKQGVAYVDINHLIKTVVGNPQLEFTYYSKFFRILGAIQTKPDSASMDNEIHQIITGGGRPAAPAKPPAKAPAAAKPPAKQPEIPPAPKGRFIFEAGKGMRRMRNNENNWGNRRSVNNSTEGSDPATKKLSNGYTVRVVDDSIKDDIQNLQFTEDEKQVFENELHFTHPFIREWLQKEENKEKWYEFWKTYINFDGSDKFHLMTYQEGQMIQNFKKEVYEAYRQYLLSAALPFLLKTANPKALQLYFNPPEAKKGFLFETVQLPPAETKEPEDEAEDETVEEDDGTVEEDDGASIGSSGADSHTPQRRAIREAYIKSDKEGKAELARYRKMGIYLGEPTPAKIKEWRTKHLKKLGRVPVEENMDSVDSWNSEETNTNAGTSYSGDSETSAGTTGSTKTTLSDESTDTNGGKIEEELDLDKIWSFLFEPISNNNVNILRPEEERITNAIVELDELIPNMPALREYVELKKEVVFPLNETKLSTEGFYKELSKIPGKDMNLLKLLRLLIRVDITNFSDQESFTRFFLKLFARKAWAKVKDYFKEKAGPQLEAEGGGKKSLRKRIKTTRKKTKKESTTVSSSRSRFRTSRKGHSK